jgi:hypothetical protein
LSEVGGAMTSVFTIFQVLVKAFSRHSYFVSFISSQYFVRSAKEIKFKTKKVEIEKNDQ